MVIAIAGPRLVRGVLHLAFHRTAWGQAGFLKALPAVGAAAALELEGQVAAERALAASQERGAAGVADLVAN